MAPRSSSPTRASGGRFGADPQAIYGNWAEFLSWARTANLPVADSYHPAQLRSPTPAPAQVLEIGLNYRSHAAESGFTVPAQPSVFTKFPSCITGPYGDITLPADGHTDWEVELVAVVGARAWQVAAAPGSTSPGWRSDRTCPSGSLSWPGLPRNSA